MTGMHRRTLLRSGILGGLAVAIPSRVATAAAAPQPHPAGAASATAFEFDEATVADLQARMTSGALTADVLCTAYLARIEAVDRSGPRLNAVIEVNPDALAIARDLDSERRAGRIRGPLHGIPVLVKDNIDTGDRMMTSAGSLALTDAPAPRDAFLIERLRAAGAVLLGKTNLSEWANFRSTRSTSGWSGRGGQTRNPYALDRNPCGSSAGSGAAASANLAVLTVGTETDGSIVCPSNNCGLVGLKPTVGLVSRSGIVPISSSQDTAGPMTRTVADAAVLLSALTGVDPRDPSTRAGAGHAIADYTTALDPRALQGARLGVARALFTKNPMTTRVIDDAIRAMRDAGAVIVDPADIPNADKLDASFEVLLHEFKTGIGEYLASRGTTTRYRTLADLIAFNEREREREMPYFGQELFEQAQRRGPLTSPAYRRALDTCRRLSRRDGIDAGLARHRLDAFLAPTGDPAWTTDCVNGDHFTGGSSTPAAVAGYPSITVPAGVVFGLPVGLSFIGPAWSEARLIGLAYAFERVTKARRPPGFPATSSLGR